MISTRTKAALAAAKARAVCDALRTPKPPWTPLLPRQMMCATTDCGRPHGRCGLAAEPGPREV